MSDQRQYSGSESRSAAGDRSPWLIAIVLSIATFMVVLDTAIANVALRYIAGSLAVSVDESTWVVTTYLIANAVVLPVSGWLSNVVGRKQFYMICVALFTIASLLCGLASSLNALIIFRILQGLGGGGMPTSEQAMLADTFTLRQRPQAFAIYGIAVIVAPTVGPTIGGWITDNYSWHWIFFINVPFGIISLILVQWLVVEPDVLERERAQRLAGGLKVDWVGFALIATTFGGLEFVLDRGQIDDWFHSTMIVTFATIAACSFIFLVPWELTRDDPIVDLRLLLQRQFGMAFVVMFAVGAILFGSNQITPQLMQTNFPYTAMLSGLAMMPGGLAMLLMMPIMGQLIPGWSRNTGSPSASPSSRWQCGTRPRSSLTRVSAISRPCACIRRSECRFCSYRSIPSPIPACQRRKPMRAPHSSTSPAILAAASVCRLPTPNWCNARNSISRGWWRT